jgi:hypothetical protein
MPIPKLMNLVVGNQRVNFDHYATGELWYTHENTGFQFPVPINDAGDGVFLASDRATFFMRWIRKHIELLEKAQAESSVEQAKP